MERLENYEKKLCFLYGFFVVPKFSSLPTHKSKSTLRQTKQQNSSFLSWCLKIKSFVSSPLPRISIELPLWNNAIERVKMFDEDRCNLQKKNQN